MGDMLSSSRQHVSLNNAQASRAWVWCVALTCSWHWCTCSLRGATHQASKLMQHVASHLPDQVGEGGEDVCLHSLLTLPEPGHQSRRCLRKDAGQQLWEALHRYSVSPTPADRACVAPDDSRTMQGMLWCGAR